LYAYFLSYGSLGDGHKFLFTVSREIGGTKKLRNLIAYALLIGVLLAGCAPVVEYVETPVYIEVEKIVEIERIVEVPIELRDFESLEELRGWLGEGRLILFGVFLVIQTAITTPYIYKRKDLRTAT